MKTQSFTWMVALALTGICAGQLQTEAERKLNEDFDKSVKQATAAYPDFEKSESAFYKKIAELDRSLEAAGDPLYKSADKPMILAERAAKDLGVVALAADAVQQTPEEMKYNADFEKSLQRATAAYPDVERAESGIAKKMIEMDKALKEASDPLYYSAEKPMILAERAAKDLSIVPIKTLAAEPEWVKEPGWDHYKPKASKYEDEVIPEFFSYKSVRIRKVEPDGLRIIHESGAAKIPIEKLTAEQRITYGLTIEGAAQYRRLVATNNSAYYAREQEAARQARADAEAAAVAAQAAAAQEAQNRANRPVAQAPVWKMFVKNKEFQERYADEIAAEVEIVNGREAAAQFRQKVKADRAAKAASAIGKEKISPSSIYQRSGDRITINGNLATGYNVRGDQLVDHATANPTHMRTGAYWVPLNDSHPTIYDP